jgi:hypothetical protein
MVRIEFQEALIVDDRPKEEVTEPLETLREHVSESELDGRGGRLLPTKAKEIFSEFLFW